jgi:pyruvate,water dikinase
MTATTLAPQHAQPLHAHAAEYVLPFAALDRHSLPVAGGKAANLGEIRRAGLPMPPGFCVTTAAYAAVAAGAALDSILDEMAATAADDTARLETLSGRAREALLAAPVPEAVAQAIVRAYETLSGGGPLPVAVRSSATAEDLPDASFAGQQETYLNVVGADAVVDAVRRCWGSLWTPRAVAYRATNGIDQRSVQLAVVVQQMVDAAVAGVMFTANPLTGRRRQAVIDASPGLGEAVVSGAVTPDHFVVDVDTGHVVERRLGDKRLQIAALPGGGTQRLDASSQFTVHSSQFCLADDEVRALARLAARVEAHYGAPQDVEWALDSGGAFWLVQTRPITTLFPLPAGAPEDDRDLRVYFNFSVAQGVLRPFTPMGVQALRLIGSALATVAGLPPRNAVAGPPVLKDAAGRIFADVTAFVRSPIGRRVVRFVLGHMEARSGELLDTLFADSRLAVRPVRPLRLAAPIARLLIRTGAPGRVLGGLRDPDAARSRLERVATGALALANLPPQATPAQHLDAVERLLLEAPPLIFPAAVAALPPAFAMLGLAGRLLGPLATREELDAVRRGLPHNPTTEMDLALWALAQRVRADAPSAAALRERAPEQLAAAYRERALPPALQQGLAEFLQRYGHRGVAEIDLGLPRWSDDPTHILGALANYLQLEGPEQAPDAQFRRAADQAEAMVVELVRRARRRGRLRGAAVAFCLRRVRQLAGLREAPKFYVVALLARARALLIPVGDHLTAAERIAAPDDIFFLDLTEARAALAGADFRPVVRERRATYEREMRRRHLPRFLLSDGTEPAAAAQQAEGDGVLRGAPASAGTVTGTARVILEPQGARLEPGEILVAPSTDPGWTPLFLTAGGLVMEMGGPMSHGAIVAREYGIPAVVGVPSATDLIATGQQITVDGAAGTITVESSAQR